MNDENNLTREQYRKEKNKRATFDESDLDQDVENQRIEFKTKQLKNKLNVLIIILIVLIVCVLCFMRFVN